MISSVYNSEPSLSVAAQDNPSEQVKRTTVLAAGWKPKWRRIVQEPSRVLLYTGWIGMLFFAFSAFSIRSDMGDTWIALACGRHHVQHGVDTVEPFSFNSIERGPTSAQVSTWPPVWQWLEEQIGLDVVQRWHPTGWINQNWLSHVLFDRLVTWFGSENSPRFEALLYLKFITNLLVLLCVYGLARVLGVCPALAAWCACFAMFVGRGYTGLRPHDFSNLFVPSFVLILALTSYRNVVWIWLNVPLAVLWGNMHGGYIYMFIMLAAFIGVHVITERLPCSRSLRSVLRAHTIALQPGTIWHVIGATIFACVAMILFNPFHLTNVTHIFEISFSKNASYWRQINEWRSVFASISYGQLRPFFAMLLLFLVAVLSLIGMMSISAIRGIAIKGNSDSSHWSTVRIDLRLLVIALLTVLMAVTSRRFIAIAAFVSCPLIALYFQKVCHLAPRLVSMSILERIPSLRRFGAHAGILAKVGVIYCLCFGASSAYAFGQRFLSPRSMNAEDQTVFSRMLSAHRMPVDACRFIRENQITGKMLNVWEEGGYLAWAQKPCLKAGRLDLELFIDGRAQAAYHHATRREWSDLVSCRPPMVANGLTEREPNAIDWSEVGQWVSQRLSEYDVTVALIPVSRRYASIAHALEVHPEWRIVYVDGMHRLFMDSRSVMGSEVYQGIADGNTKFPDTSTRQLSLAYSLMKESGVHELRREGLGYAMGLFQSRQTPFVASLITGAGLDDPRLHPEVLRFCSDLVSGLRFGEKHLSTENTSLKKRRALERLKRFLEDQQ